MEFKVELTNEHLNRNSKIKNLDAINEIIWNSIDADSNKIDIFFDCSNEIDLEKITGIRVIDDGVGISYNEVKNFLQPYGRSEKNIKDFLVKDDNITEN